MCILLVEDEPLIRLMLAETLEDDGFEVMAAANGDKAAALIEMQPERFTLLITDIQMPGEVNGVEIARRLRVRRPEIPVVFTTGRPDMLTGKMPMLEKDVLVEKPYGPSHVLAAVRLLLRG